MPDQLPLFAAGSPANRSATPGSEGARKTTATYGRKCAALLTKSAPGGLWLKTLLALEAWNSTQRFLKWEVDSLPATRMKIFTVEHYHDKANCISTQSVKTLSDTVTRSTRLRFRLVPSAPRTSGNGSGLWPTPRSGKINTEDAETWAKRKEAGGVATPPLALAVKMFPTPQTRDHYPPHRPEYIQEKKRQGHGMSNLNDHIQMFPTPRANDAEKRGNVSTDPRHGLPGAVRGGFWPTPKSSLNGPDYARAGREGSGGDDLVTAVSRVEFYPTPRAAEWKGCGPVGSNSHEHRLGKGYLDATVQDREQLTGSLNPDWVEWLMGVPRGWTNPDVANEAIRRPGPLPDVHEWEPEPDISRLVPAGPHWAARLKVLGNMIVPQVFGRIAWAIKKDMEHDPAL